MSLLPIFCQQGLVWYVQTCSNWHFFTTYSFLLSCSFSAINWQFFLVKNLYTFLPFTFHTSIIAPQAIVNSYIIILLNTFWCLFYSMQNYVPGVSFVQCKKSCTYFFVTSYRPWGGFCLLARFPIISLKQAVKRYEVGNKYKQKLWKDFENQSLLTLLNSQSMLLLP